MKDNNKPGTALQPQAQAVIQISELFKPPDIDETNSGIDAIIDGNKKLKIKPHPEISRLKESSTVACKIGRSLKVETEADVKTVNHHITYLDNIQEEMKGIFEAPRDYLHKVKEHVLKRRKEMVQDLVEVQGLLKAEIRTYVTAKAEALRKKNDEAIARAAEETRKKQEALQTRAQKWEEKKPEKAEQLREEAAAVAVMPDIIPEDPKNWIFTAFVLNKRLLLRELVDDPKSDLTGVVIQKSLLNAIARAAMSERPQKTMKTSWGYVEGEKKK